MVQNVRYSNGPPSHVTLPFEYRILILSGIQVFGIQMVTVTCLNPFSTFLGQPGRRLNDYVHHYEPLSYDAVDHLRVKRSTVDGDDDGVRLNFASHGRQFNLRLKRDLSVFPDNIRIEDREGRRLQHLVRLDIVASHAYKIPLESRAYTIVSRCLRVAIRGVIIFRTRPNC